MSDYIGIDVLSLILKWLPVKTLFRFKSVCKSWKQLIESDSFAIEHLSAQTQNPLVIVRNQTWNDLKLFDPRSLPAWTGTITHHPNDFPVDGNVNPSDVLHTLHGVICLYNRTTSQILVWNPSIRRFLTVPPRAPGSPHKLCGFWFDPCKSRFKVLICVLSPVRTAMAHEAMAQEFAVYSSGDQAWNQVPRAADNLGTIFMKTYGVSEVLIDGVAHWIALSHSGECVVMSFKLSTDDGDEELEIIKLPEALQPRRGEVSLCKWQGSRSVVHCQVEFPRTSCSIWAMIDGAWSMMLSFDLRGTVYQACCVLQDSGKVLAKAWNGAASELVLCDPHSGEHIRHLTPSVLCKPTASVASDFVETLVFPDPYGVSSGY